MLSPSINRGHLSVKAKFLIPLFVLCVLVPLAALRLPAESLSGKVSGTIHDPSGAGVANLGGTAAKVGYKLLTGDFAGAARPGGSAPGVAPTAAPSSTGAGQGSMDAARRAGSIEAMNAAAIKTAREPKRQIGLYGDTP